MNKTKHPEVKKTLVRNPGQSTPKTAAVTQSRASAKCTTGTSAASSKPLQTGVSKDKIERTRFNTPELHSTLKLSKKIDEVVEPRKTKSLSDVDKSKLAVDEKVSRKVNFHFSQPVFKDLIPLMNNEVKSQPVLTSRGPNLPKDKEPLLSDFLEPKKSKVYYHLPSCGARFFGGSRIPFAATNSLQLYKTLQINEEK